MLSIFACAPPIYDALYYVSLVIQINQYVFSLLIAVLEMHK